MYLVILPPFFSYTKLNEIQDHGQQQRSHQNDFNFNYLKGDLSPNPKRVLPITIQSLTYT